MILRFGYWIPYFGAYILLWCCRLGECQHKIFVDCYNCTAHGLSECYGSSRRCPYGANAFYCYTFYEFQIGAKEKGCATDHQLRSWLSESESELGTYVCKDTKNGARVCYCKNDVPPCPSHSNAAVPAEKQDIPSPTAAQTQTTSSVVFSTLTIPVDPGGFDIQFLSNKTTTKTKVVAKTYVTHMSKKPIPATTTLSNGYETENSHEVYVLMTSTAKQVGNNEERCAFYSLKIILFCIWLGVPM